MTSLLVAVGAILTVMAVQAPDPQEDRSTSRPASARDSAIVFEEKSSKTPYADLFQPPRDDTPQDDEGENHSLKRRVICGMVVIEVDGSADPRIRAPKLTDDTVRYTMRVVEPSICKN